MLSHLEVKGLVWGICIEIVRAVVGGVLCDCTCVSSGKEENKSVPLSLGGLRSASIRTMSWSLIPGITLVLENIVCEEYV